MSVDAPLWVEHTGPRLEESDHLRRQNERRKTGCHGVGREHLMREPMLTRAAEGSGYEHTVPVPDHQPSRLIEQTAGRFALEVGPELIRPLHQRYVMGMLVIRLANDPGQSMGRTKRVRRVEAIEAHGPNASLRQVEE